MVFEKCNAGPVFELQYIHRVQLNKKAVLSQGNRAVQQLIKQISTAINAVV